MKVSNMYSTRTNNKVANQFVIKGNNATYFQSYNSIIVKIEDGKTYLDEYYWNYSRTTSKYRSSFLMENTKETEKKIKEGLLNTVEVSLDLSSSPHAP
jgi:hypothetical protein